MADDLQTTMDALLSCLVTALDDSGRSVAKSGHTVGPAILGPSVCCSECSECGEGNGGHGQLSVAFQQLIPVDANTFGQQVRVENCKPGAVAANLTFTLARCHPTVKVSGQNFVVPTLDEVAPYADGAEDDAQIMWNSLGCPCGGYKVVIRQVSVDSDPEGGCSAVGMQVSVLVKPKTP